MDIDDVARDLYAVLPADFVSTRTASAKDARAAGDAALARRIAALRKPTKAAWATNLLVRRERDRVDTLLALGVELRDAQDRLDAAELRAAASRRRALVADLVGDARRLAEQAGEPLGDPGADAVARTLNAALTDARAAAALETGLLVDSLTSTGFEPIDLDGLVAVPEAVGDVVGRPRLRLVKSPEPTSRQKAKKAEKAEQAEPPTSRQKPKKAEQPKPEKAKAEKAKKEAGAALRAARERLSSARDAVSAAQQRAAAATDAVDDLERRRAALRDELEGIDAALTRGQREAKEALRANAAAEREEARARRALDDLS